MKLIDAFNPFLKPSPEVMAVQELQDARRSLLEAQTGLDWARAAVAYNEARVARLTAIVQNTTNSDTISSTN